MQITTSHSYKRYAQLKTLAEMFDLSEDYFKRRMSYAREQRDSKRPFVEGTHFFIPESTSATKKIVLWDIAEIDRWIRVGRSMDHSMSQDEQDAQKLLRRTAFFSYDFTIPSWLRQIFEKIFRSKF